MICSIVTNEAKLSIPCELVTDLSKVDKVIEDLIDTADYWRRNPGGNGCLGLAANQIGFLSRVCVVWISGRFVPMINPEVKPVHRSPADNRREGCLSRPGVFVRKKRFKKIIVSYAVDAPIGVIEAKITGMTARVIQHEVDHLNGVYI